ncbi:uncharacterized protein N7498_010260 [Penicillium cinerascens]|uniref:Calcineurin-like phosphoesterase domain-containing protein n=1 Tax=Penicillium cinerascens TaxID=70096 RepID=A0A9W9M6N9_9EURO|nr:uncharacterized protein N7498_010260 [Penicillium cinerascens]KAJ5191275.1 hypothetical protein N7498_010260 [Penicillium cinerascens]
MAAHGSDLDYDEADSYYAPNARSRFSRVSRPLIDSARNGWQSNSNPTYHPLSSSPDDRDPDCLQIACSVVSAPRFRRYVLLYLTLFTLCWTGWTFMMSPALEERETLQQSLDPTKADVGGWFGTNSRPRFDELTHIASLDPALVPGPETQGSKSGSRSQKRLIVVGDVHGCKEELVKLLDKVSFSREDGDHLIFTGDLINKGPDSGGVVDLARELNASSVRGNHEDRILLHRGNIEASKDFPATESESKDNDEFFSSKVLDERALACSLSNEQVEWLNSCPVILKVGQIPNMGQVVVVHGGLVPGVDLEKQDPSAVMNMRSIDKKTHVPSSDTEGVKWDKMFDKHQSTVYSSLKATSKDPRSQTTTVIYGHYAKQGLNIREYTKGLDSGCVKGGKLTALIIEDGGKQSIVQVRCHKYLKD